jgi:hypothetical protein
VSPSDLRFRGRQPAAVRGWLTSVERAWLAAEVLVTYVGVRRQLRQRDLPAVVEHLRRASGGAARHRLVGRDERHIAAIAVRVLQRLPGDSRCLTRCLVVLAMLARRGIAVRLVVAARPAPAFAAHAWIEHGGRPLLPTEGFGDGRLVEL